MSRQPMYISPIDENRISVRVEDHATRRAGICLVCFAGKRDALGFERFLNLSDIGERIESLPGGVPAGIERESVLLEHTLEETDHAAWAGHFIMSQPWLSSPPIGANPSFS